MACFGAGRRGREVRRVDGNPHYPSYDPWIDELLDPRRDPRPQPEEAAAVRNELSRMLGITPDPTHPFAPRYLSILQESPHVVMAHATVREALRGLSTALA